jgi:hypothetical protein
MRRDFPSNEDDAVVLRQETDDAMRILAVSFLFWMPSGTMRRKITGGKIGTPADLVFGVCWGRQGHLTDDVLGPATPSPGSLTGYRLPVDIVISSALQYLTSATDAYLPSLTGHSPRLSAQWSTTTMMMRGEMFGAGVR